MLYKRFHFHSEEKGMGLFMVKSQVETLGVKLAQTEWLLRVQNLLLLLSIKPIFLTNTPRLVP
jgi:hypothetical protein